MGLYKLDAMSNYSKKLKDPRWQKKRLQIMNRDKFTCKLCNDDKTTLNVHHLKYTEKNVWDEPKENLITLCEHCHFEVEDIKKDEGDFDFKELSMLKLDNWNSGSRIMFFSLLGNFAIRIYDKEGCFIIGFNFTKKDYKLINKLIGKAIKFYRNNPIKPF